MVLPLRDDNPTRTRPVVTVALIVACTVIFLLQVMVDPVGQRVAYAFGAIPAVLIGGRELPPELAVIPAPVTVLTSMFLHGGWLHLGGNMLYLWIFGNNIEDAMGHVRFIVFYVLCGIAAVFAHALPDPASTVPMVGASGAISGVLGAYLLLYPHARVLIGLPLGFMLVQIGWFPALIVLALWFLMQLLMNTFGGDAGVAFRAHIGGFLAGMALIPFFKHRHVPFWRGGNRY